MNGVKKLIMLGTGNAMVTKVFNTCFLIELPDGELFMTDAGGGNGILRQMELAGADYRRLHHMFVTHGHTDHILGAIWMIRKIASLMNNGKYQGQLHIYCHDVVKDMLEKICAMMLKKKDLANVGRDILIHEVRDGEKVELPELTLTAFDIFSTKAKQFGYRMVFKDDGLVLTCLGDEPYNPQCRQYVEGADWLMSEAFCKYDDRDEFKPYEKNHSTVKEAGELAQQLGVGHVVLYHTEDKTISTRKREYRRECEKYFSGRVFVPDDLDVIGLVRYKF